MGRLYDKIDLAWNLAYWDRKEQELSAQIATGWRSSSCLDEVLTYPARCNCTVPCGREHHKYVKRRDSFKLERERERMKLLRTQSLLADWAWAKRMFEECAHCHYEVGPRGGEVIVECQLHTPAFEKARKAIYWAGKENQAEREARGQFRMDDGATAVENAETAVPSTGENPLNQWESAYHRDKAEGVWTPQDAQLYDAPYSYEGWLDMLLQNEEMTEAEYLGELRRLKQERDEAAGNAPQWAGMDSLKQGSKKGSLRNREVFKKDTRYSRI